MRKIFETLSPFHKEVPKEDSVLTKEVWAALSKLEKRCPNEHCEKGIITREQCNEDYKRCWTVTEKCPTCNGKGYLRITWS